MADSPTITHGVLQDPGELRRQVELFHHAQSVGQYGAFDWDLQRDQILWSDRTFELLGREPGEVEHTWQGFQSCVHPDDLEDVQRAAAEVIATGVHPDVRYRVVWPDGSIRHMVSRGALFHDEDGEPVRMVGFMQDITDQVRAERALDRQQHLLEEAQRLGRIGSWSYDLTTGDVEWSTTTYEIYGLEPGTPIRLDQAVAGLIPEDQPRARQRVARALEERSGYDETFTVLTPAGERRRIQTIARVEVDGDEVTRLFGMIRDVTEEERHIEERLRLDRLQTLGHLAAGIAHDLNNCLTAATVGVSSAQESAESLNEVEALRDALNSLRTARDIASQLMAFSRGGSTDRRPIDLRSLIPGVVTFTLRGQGACSVLALGAAPLRVVAHTGQLEQLFSNLVLNAAQAMSDGGSVHVRGGLEGQTVWIEVEDEGPGVDASVREHLFDPYVTTKDDGTGLGLATCRAVVQNHGGTIALASARPTVFRIELPAAPPDSDSAAAADEGPRAALAASLEGRTVVAYDDNATIRTLLLRSLARLGATVRTCQTAPELWDHLATEPDLVILDATVPGQPGANELLPEIRRRHPGVRTVLSSGYAQGDGDPSAPTLRFDGVLPKPYTLRELQRVLTEALGTR